MTSVRQHYDTIQSQICAENVFFLAASFSQMIQKTFIYK